MWYLAVKQKVSDQALVVSLSACCWEPTDGLLAAVKDRYLVDPASSHMLVSKIKPCMSKYKRFIPWNCEWLIKTVIIYLMFYHLLGITVVILELIHAYTPDSRRVAFTGLKTNRACPFLVNHGNFWIAWPCAGDRSFKFLPYQLSMVG